MRSAFADWLAPLRQCEWVVYAKRPFAGPAAVLAYLSRYTHRVAISNSRLLAMDERGVTFRWKDYRAKGKTRYKTMTLSAEEFMRRFLLHVLPSGFHRIRHYGLLANAARRDNLARARELLHVAPEAAEPQPPMSPQPSFSPSSSAATVVRRCSSSRPSHAGNRFVPHRHRESQHDQTLLLSRCVRSSSTSVDSARLCLRCAQRRLLRRRISQESAIATTPLHIPSTSSDVPPAQLPLTARLPTSNPHSAVARRRLQRCIPRFPPSRLVRRLPASSVVSSRTCGSGQASDNP